MVFAVRSLQLKARHLDCSDMVDTSHSAVALLLLLSEIMHRRAVRLFDLISGFAHP